MNKYKIKTTILLSIFMLLGCFVCGCAKVESSVKETSEASKIAFSWWGNDPRHLYTMEGVDEFMLENPDIRVEYKYGIWNG
ncbi:MAG: carbohydrate ABC transporter substrate-binding protein, partial [Lachnospiraceae bacterium]|nr:carbohydrate ABC transporter substrate-binding protein [Lachnospiraceae bacterium]